MRVLRIDLNQSVGDIALARIDEDPLFRGARVAVYDSDIEVYAAVVQEVSATSVTLLVDFTRVVQT